MQKIIILSMLLILSGCQLKDYPFIPHEKYSTLIANKVRVIDGDTIEATVLEEKYRIRLVGIDAPEYSQENGYASTENLYKCLINKHITIKWQKKDKYDRILGTVYADDADCNFRQIKEGYAWHYKQYQNEQPERQRISYANAETNAQKMKIGLWKQACVQAPWDWRHKKPFTCDNFILSN